MKHDETQRRFVITLGEHQAVLDYELEGTEAHFTHTFVPPELRGRGLAEKLVEAGLAWAASRSLRVVPECSYVAKYLERKQRA